MGSTASVVQPAFNPQKDIEKFVSAYGGALPQVLGFEKQFRPEFQGLNLQDISSFLSGAGGQQGLFGLSRTAAQEAGGQIGAAREGELGTMTGQAPLTRGLMQALSPEQAAAVAASAQEAERARAAAQGVTPQERRNYEQLTREGFQSAGRLGGNLNIASEAMAREDVLARKRAEAAAAGQNAYNLAGSFYTQPGLGLLSQQPLSYQTGQQLLGIGLGSIGRGTPGLINPDTGLNLGAANRQNMLQAQMANAQADAAQKAAMWNTFGEITGSATKLATGGMK
jgi:hypothetical protein